MSATTYDRTRWDRLQACLLLGTIAVLSSTPLWAAIMLLTATVEVHP